MSDTGDQGPLPPDQVQSCSFCGRSSTQVEVMVTGPHDAYICERCVWSSVQVVQQGHKQEEVALPMEEVPLPQEIKSELDRYIVGQEQAKKTIAVAVYNHYKRIHSHSQDDDGVEIEKSNILLVGPTGTGKTLIAQTLARFLNVPFAIADATALTEAGYVGEDVENILVRLLQAADFEIARAERGIIYIDEMDKISRKDVNVSITRDVSGQGVQQALLKILEGTVASVPPKGGRKHPEQNLLNVDTRNILFICGGTFEGLEEIIQHRVDDTSMGFGADVKSHSDADAIALRHQLEPEDLVRFGFIPEIVGRLPVICALEDLKEEALLAILTRPRNALIKQYQKLFGMEGIKLTFEKAALKEVVRQAMKRKSGARGLRSILETAMLDIMYELPALEGVEGCIITLKVLTEGAEPELVRRKRA